MMKEINHLCYLDDVNGEQLLLLNRYANLPLDKDLTSQHAREIFEAFGLPPEKGEVYFNGQRLGGWSDRQPYPNQWQTYDVVYTAYMAWKSEQQEQVKRTRIDRSKRIKGGVLKTAFDRLPYHLYSRLNNADPSASDAQDVLALYGIPADIARDVFNEIEAAGWPSSCSRLDHLKAVGADMREEARLSR